MTLLEFSILMYLHGFTAAVLADCVTMLVHQLIEAQERKCAKQGALASPVSRMRPFPRLKGK